MSVVKPVPEDALIEAYNAAQSTLRNAEFPQLIVDEVIDDGESYLALRCPRCGDLIDEGELFAISPAEQWAPNEDVDEEGSEITFDSGDRPDLDETLYYMHGDMRGHAVSLPDGWTEDWT